jgi:hypothetical protein
LQRADEPIAPAGGTSTSTCISSTGARVAGARTSPNDRALSTTAWRCGPSVPTLPSGWLGAMKSAAVPLAWLDSWVAPRIGR